MRLLGLTKKLLPVVHIGMVTKYHGSGEYHLPDSYVSVVEALKHAAVDAGVQVEIEWIDAEDLSTFKDPENYLDHCPGVLVPQGWGARGAEGKIRAIQYAREKRVPFPGLCYGMQMALV